ncbi:hypothetical protein JG688_00018596 [Phytophthora aleatoria]|uniref:Uncharacterized protein n=1 Tax=Phytophthora aleatoria TaxID=2496075 RepID=A0A8J5IF74_9STRA|nr:hypothetical protein JG688_00018596 [Phytophthora aleatoria]
MCFTNMVIASQLFAGEVAASPRSRSRCERCESMRLICGAQNASCGIWPIRLRTLASTRTLCPGYTRCQRARRLFRWRIRTLRLTRDGLVNSLAAEHYSRQCSAALQFSTASCMMELLQHQGTWPTRAAHKEGGWRDACNVGINGGAATRTRCTGPGYLSAH